MQSAKTTTLGDVLRSDLWLFNSLSTGELNLATADKHETKVKRTTINPVCLT